MSLILLPLVCILFFADVKTSEFAPERKSKNDLTSEDIKAVNFLQRNGYLPLTTPSEQTSKLALITAFRDYQITTNVTFKSLPDELQSLVCSNTPINEFDCAVVYKGERCYGESLSIESGYRSMQLNPDWYNKISSAQVNSMCQLKLCRLTSFGGGCVHLGEEKPTDYLNLDLEYDDNIASLACTCDQDKNDTTTLNTEEPATDVSPLMCPTIIDTLKCAVVYTEKRCFGKRIEIDVGQEMKQLSNSISSIQLPPHCTLKLCRFENLNQPCVNLTSAFSTGEIYDRLPFGYNDLVASLACFCDNSADGARYETPSQGHSYHHYSYAAAGVVPAGGLCFLVRRICRKKKRDDEMILVQH